MKKLIAIIISVMLVALPLTANAAIVTEGKISVSDIIGSVKNNCASCGANEGTSTSCPAKNLISSLIGGACANGNCGVSDILKGFISGGTDTDSLKNTVNDLLGKLLGNLGTVTDKDETECPDGNCGAEEPETPDCPNGNCGNEDKDCPNGNCPVEEPETPEVNTPVETPNKDDAYASESSYVNDVVRLVNKYRNASGLASVTLDSALCKAADVRAKEIKTSFSHTRPSGASCFSVLSELGISYMGAGENIAYGQSSPDEVMTAWMNSEGHRANIMNSSFTKLGVGVYTQGSVIYWSQMFTY